MSFKHVGPELQALLSEWMEKPQARGLVLEDGFETPLAVVHDHRAPSQPVEML